MLFSDIDSNNNQEILGTTGDIHFWVRDNNGSELEQWCVNTSCLNPFVSLSMGKVTEEYDNYILLTTQNGTVFALPVGPFISSISEWSQYQNNARNTGCYFQPLPEDITYNITVKHNVVIDKTIRFPTQNVTLTIEPGNEILFKPSGSIFGGNILAIGTEDNLILFVGLCTDSTNNYWSGISIVENSKCHFEHCNLQNAVVAILLEDIKDQHIENCFIENNYKGIYLSNISSNNNIIGNSITGNTYGIFSVDAANNSIFGNTIADNSHGIHLLSNTIDNIIYHNNFVNNTQNAYDECSNFWYNLTLQEGNYWSDFDEESEGAYDNNSDGIVDLPYDISGGSNQDLYPLIEPWSDTPDLVIPDENEQGERLNKCRYIAFTPADTGLPQAFRVTILQCPQFPYMECFQYWVSEPGFYGIFCDLQTEPFYHDELDHMFLVGDQRIVPSTLEYGTTTYRVEATFDNISFSDPVDIDTAVWGDVYPGVVRWAPDNCCEGFDILTVLDAAAGFPPPYETSFLDLAPKHLDHCIEGMDLISVVDAAMGEPYYDDWAPTP